MEAICYQLGNIYTYSFGTVIINLYQNIDNSHSIVYIYHWILTARVTAEETVVIAAHVGPIIKLEIFTCH